MQAFTSNLTESARRKFEYLNLAGFHQNNTDPLTNKTFAKRALELPTSDLGYLLAIVKEKQNDQFTLTAVDGHSYQNLISTASGHEESKILNLGAKVYWYFVATAGLNYTYFLGAAKPIDQKIASTEHELFYKATKNDPIALLQLGSRFYYGTERLPKSRPLAIACINHDAVGKDTKALYLRGMMRLRGELPYRTIHEALADIRSAAFLNLPEALFVLGTFAETGQHTVKQSASTAFTYYKRAAELKHSEALVKLGNYYAYGHKFNQAPPYVNSDQYAAMRYYRKGAMLGNIDAMVLTANMFSCSSTLPYCPDLAAKYLYMAAEAGCHTSHERLMTYTYFKDKKPSIMDCSPSEQTFLDPFDAYMPREDRTLHFTMEELVKLHDKDIAYQIAVKLLNDIGIKIFTDKIKIASRNLAPLHARKQATALQLLSFAARLQHADAHFVLGHAALSELSAYLPRTKAIDHFEKSVNLGCIDGIYGLALCYKEGLGDGISHEHYLDQLRIAMAKGIPVNPKVMRDAQKVSYANALQGLNAATPHSEERKQEALAILKKLAESDQMACAQFTLGMVYCSGEVIPVNIPEATFWVEQSLANGFKPNSEQQDQMHYLQQAAARDDEVSGASNEKPQELDESPPKKKRGRPKLKREPASASVHEASAHLASIGKRRDQKSEEGSITRAKRRKIEESQRPQPLNSSLPPDS